MRRGTLRNPAWTLAAFGLAVALSACGSDEGANDPGQLQPGPQPGEPGYPGAPGEAQTPEEQVKQILDARKADYGEALRTASLKLRDELPSLAEIKTIEAAADEAGKKAAYEKLVDDMLASPKFSNVMVKFWKDTFRTAQVGAIQQGQPNKDTAANFAAQVVVEGRNYSELFTATANTCPTFDAATSTFTPAACPAHPSGQATVGLLTDSGLLAQYYSNMAFRRLRFIQETFACQKFPAEYSSTPKPMGNGTFTGTQPFESITGKQNKPDARIDFQDTQAVICANCHSTMNHLTPLLMGANEAGLFQTPTAQNPSEVLVPIPGEPRARRIDYLPDGEGFFWRAGKPVTDLSSLGAAIAADPEVGRCAVNRVWNYALSRGDIVNDLATIPNAVTDGFRTQFAANNGNLKEIIRGVFKSEDFVKF
ncbi:MAG: DUF1549 domain-containing protein [Labilithrix sp.]|nr:DUF1549 domain-containing protein [Labilithrix sp.]